MSYALTAVKGTSTQHMGTLAPCSQCTLSYQTTLAQPNGQQNVDQ